MPRFKFKITYSGSDHECLTRIANVVHDLTGRDVRPTAALSPACDLLAREFGWTVHTVAALELPELLFHLRRLQDRRAQSPAPAWKRLRLREGTGGDLAELDGKRHRLRGAGDLRFLRMLQDHQGLPVKAQVLERDGTRPDRVYNRLPKALQRIIDRPKRGRQGYRMR